MDPRPILTFNCHEPYLHTLAKVGFPLEVVDGLPGRRVSRWDARSRPVPPNVRLVAPQSVGGASAYRAVIAHNISDLLLARELDVPKLIVLHVSLEARLAEERPGFAAAEMGEQLRTYLALVRGVAVGVSEAKLTSWRLDGTVIPPAIDPADYFGFEGGTARALRVAHQVASRKDRFAWDVHEAICAGMPVTLVGDNPELGSTAAASWDELRAAYRSHRCLVHTAKAGLEDGYNLAVLEAMGTGMPVLTNGSASTPVVDGESGFVNDDPAALRAAMSALLTDLPLAQRLGAAAREQALGRFALEPFRQRWRSALELAAARHASG